MKLFKLVSLVLGLSVFVSGIVAAQTTARVTGCITDTSGRALAGVTVSVIGNDIRRSVVSNGTGCYIVADVPGGSYVLFAQLPGFVSFTRDELQLHSERPQDVTFEMPVAALCECIGGTFASTWERADAVVRIRITAHKPQSDPTEQIHTAAVIMTWKQHATHGPAETLTFVQPRRTYESEPYAIGQEFVIFLSWQEETGTFTRMTDGDGNGIAFAIEGGRVRNSGRFSQYSKMSADEFLAELGKLSSR